MLRNAWEFDYKASDVAAQAKKCSEHHKERLKFWQDKSEEVFIKAKADGLEISESVAGHGYAQTQLSNIGRRPRLMVKTEYQDDLDEADIKVREHQAKILEYDAFANALSINPNTIIKLNVDDINYFYRFSKDE